MNITKKAGLAAAIAAVTMTIVVPGAIAQTGNQINTEGEVTNSESTSPSGATTTTPTTSTSPTAPTEDNDSPDPLDKPSPIEAVINEMSYPDTTVNAGETATASISDVKGLVDLGQNVKYAIQDGPDWVSIDEDTGEIIYAPDLSVEGEFDLVINILDASEEGGVEEGGASESGTEEGGAEEGVTDENTEDVAEEGVTDTTAEEAAEEGAEGAADEGTTGENTGGTTEEGSASEGSTLDENTEGAAEGDVLGTVEAHVTVVPVEDDEDRPTTRPMTDNNESQDPDRADDEGESGVNSQESSAGGISGGSDGYIPRNTDNYSNGFADDSDLHIPEWERIAGGSSVGGVEDEELGAEVNTGGSVEASLFAKIKNFL